MRWLWCALALTVFGGCGTRTPKDDSVCDAEKPKAYEKPPLISSCSEVRLNQSVTDPATGTTESNVHRLVHCCE